MKILTNYFELNDIIWFCRYINPKPEISIYREASFGHGQLQVVNATHAQWTWHRNDNDEQVVGDSFWITSLSSNPACKVWKCALLNDNGKYHTENLLLGKKKKRCRN